MMDFMDELQALEREKGVPAEAILDALANALVSAYKRTPGAAEEARVTIDPDTGEITVYGQELDEDGNVTREWVDTPSGPRSTTPTRAGTATWSPASSSSPTTAR
jgi:N utilization substance protein A